MEVEPYNPGMIKAEKAVEILKKKGIIVNIEEAKNLLEFMYFLANLSIDHYIDQHH